FDATLTLLYRLLFVLYAESRGLLPVAQGPDRAASLRALKEEIAAQAGPTEAEAPDRLAAAYTETSTALYDRLTGLCRALHEGDAGRGGRFLANHKVPDRPLALALDRLARAPDDKECNLVFIDYKALEVRHLGAIYEGLLEFKLKVATEDLTTRTDKKQEKYIPLAQTKVRRGQTAAIVV